MSLASAWVFWKKYNHRIGEIVLGILLFAAGWQVGRVTSPYYATNPIVFQEASGISAEQNNGSPEALLALKEAGLKGEPAPAIAGVTTAEPSLTPTLSPTTSVAQAAARLFVGSKNSTLYHHKDCSAAKQIKEENQLWWPTKEAAEAAGYKPSKCTQDKLGQ